MFPLTALLDSLTLNSKNKEKKPFLGETLSTGIILQKESKDEVMDEVVNAVQGS